MSRPDTKAVHGGRRGPVRAQPLTTPIYQSTTFVFDDVAALEAYHAGEADEYLYSRYGNPTVEVVEAHLAALEGAEAALATASGMAATTTALFGLLEAGDEVLAGSAIYGGSAHLMRTFLRRFGVTVRFVPAGEDFVSHIADRTRLVWFESPTNPTLACLDIQRIADACRRRSVLSVFDNTFASPINQQPLSLGVDLVMHSATKYLNGHSDVTAGVLAGSAALIARLETARRFFGGVLDPGAAYALQRGIKTLGVRVTRQNASAGRIAEWLLADPRVRLVRYPGLPSHPDHELARRQMRGFGGIVTFAIGGSLEAASAVFDRFTLVGRAASLGGVETICSLPVLTSHHGFAGDDLDAAGVAPDMLRLSVGLEDVDDLIADLDRALGRGAEPVSSP